MKFNMLLQEMINQTLPESQSRTRLEDLSTYKRVIARGRCISAISQWVFHLYQLTLSCFFGQYWAKGKLA